MPEEQSVDREILSRLEGIDTRQASMARDLNKHLGICEECQKTISRVVRSIDGNDGTGLKQRVATLETRQADDSDKIKTIQEGPESSGGALTIPSKWLVAVLAGLVPIIAAIGGCTSTLLAELLKGTQ